MSHIAEKVILISFLLYVVMVCVMVTGRNPVTTLVNVLEPTYAIFLNGGKKVGEKEDWSDSWPIEVETKENIPKVEEAPKEDKEDSIFKKVYDKIIEELEPSQPTTTYEEFQVLMEAAERNWEENGKQEWLDRVYGSSNPASRANDPYIAEDAKFRTKYGFSNKDSYNRQR